MALVLKPFPLRGGSGGSHPFESDSGFTLGFREAERGQFAAGICVGMLKHS